MDTHEEKFQLRKLSIDHARGWFTNHADQRLTLVRFFLILVAALLVAYLTSVKEKFLPGQLISAIFGMISPFLFSALDTRVSYLIKVGEAALSKQEEYVARELGDANLEITKKADQKPHGMLSYRQLFKRMHVTSFCVFAFALFYSLYYWSKSL